MPVLGVPALREPCLPEVSGYASSLREALVPIVADHKCSSPEVYGADVSPNMLCAGYFDCKSDACQVGTRPAGKGMGYPSKHPNMGTQMGRPKPRDRAWRSHATKPTVRSPARAVQVTADTKGTSLGLDSSPSIHLSIRSIPGRYSLVIARLHITRQHGGLLYAHF